MNLLYTCHRCACAAALMLATYLAGSCLQPNLLARIADVGRLRAKWLRIRVGQYPCGGLRTEVTADAVLLSDARSSVVTTYISRIAFLRPFHWSACGSIGEPVFGSHC